jgi:hypothetical protein
MFLVLFSYKKISRTNSKTTLYSPVERSSFLIILFINGLFDNAAST